MTTTRASAPNRRPWLLVLMLGMLLAGAATATETGMVFGSVTTGADETPIAKAQVTLAGRLLMNGERTAITDATGRYRFILLPPGRYTLTVRAAGYVTVIEREVLVELGGHLHQPYTMVEGAALPADERKYYELGTNPTRVALGRNIRPSFTDLIVTPRTHQRLALLVPGTIDAYGGSGSVSIHGASARSNQYLLDGMIVTDPADGLSNARLNFDSVLETQILTAGLDAEYGYTTGGVINTLTLSGADEFDVDASIYFAPNVLRTAGAGDARTSESLVGNVRVGGPIIRKKLWFQVTASVLNDVENSLAQQNVFPLVPLLAPRSQRGLWLSGKLQYRPFDWQTIQVFIQGDPTWENHSDQDPLVHPSAGTQTYRGGMNLGFRSETRLGENVVWRTILGYSTNRLESSPVSSDFATPGRLNSVTGTRTVNDTFIRDDNRFRLQFRSTAAYYLDEFFGSHEFKAGVEAHLAWATLDEDLTGGRVFVDQGLMDNPNGTLVGAPDRELRVTQPLSTFVWGNTLSAFVQDVWNPFSNVTIRPGIRFDSSRTYNDAVDGGAEIYNFNWPSPRIGMSWDPFSDGKTAVRGGYYHYSDMGNLSLPRFVGRSLALDAYAYNDATGQYDVALGPVPGSNTVAFNQALVPPVMHELVLGFSREIFDHATLSLDLVFRRWNNLFEDTENNVQWNQSGSGATGYRNGRDEFILTLDTRPDAFNQYVGVDITFDKRLADRWSLLATYTYAQLEGSVEELLSYSFNNPRQAPFEFGFLRNDVRHNARVYLTYELPFGLTAGLAAQYQSGRPFSKLFYNEVYDAYVDRRAPRGFDPRDEADPTDDLELRMPDSFLVDLRFVWRLKELTDQDLWFIVELQNVLNRQPATLVEERNVSGAVNFGDALRREDPLRGTVALRYVF